MSREERKMAQIIASIERMEQETRASGDDSSRTQEASESVRQGFRGKKTKKGKIIGVKFKNDKKLKVTAVVEGNRMPFERNLTPKKRWIQLWNAQMDEGKDGDASISTIVTYETAENQMSVSPAVASSPVSEIKVAPAIPSTSLATADQEETPTITIKLENVSMEAISSVDLAQSDEKEPLSSTRVSVMKNESHEVNTEKLLTEPSKVALTQDAVASSQSLLTLRTNCATASSSSELRVETPLMNESSHLSPPVERSSPTTTASISPSGKIKETDTSNNNTATAVATAAKFSPTTTSQKDCVTEKELSRKDTVSGLARKSSRNNLDIVGDSHRTTSSGRDSELVRKRSVELIDPPMSEEAKQRAERRRKRKSNWDVGDPRKGGSPVADPPVSAAAAAANQQSFAKYPPNRPSWRSSQSIIDLKPQFQSGHRPSSFYNKAFSSASRRGFYHSSPVSQDRSRSAGRSSARHSYVNSSSHYR
ncbi:uncharacterized protein PHALS_13439 [Plasmopara halstedii]|uniref:Uncharacterized protein n=1 Tax=Plasmopara halstedii TaxID=4781 RepID=A0A0N7L642_PLAHL|nr:uncharacterized protein PHALS_13439 [Plasmopara halstedii]CEG43227.1 hypothetical protein PHALS_13439 [Plasmopara halstedii]|eukprot:XP_024579596.1 hypothetical protein PHALS_13439 [Plasmopara halstedii]